MKKTTLYRSMITVSVMVICFLIIAIMPGLNFSVGSAKYIAVERISRPDWQVGGLVLLDHALVYEWNSKGTLRIAGSEGFSMEMGAPYFRVGNFEIYMLGFF